MRHYGVKSQKATCLWSNSWHIQYLDNGPVPKALRDASQPLAKTYRDQGGVKRCTGKKKELKESQFLISAFIQSFELLWGSWTSFDLWTCCFHSVLVPWPKGVHKSIRAQDRFHISKFVRWSPGLAFWQGLSLVSCCFSFDTVQPYDGYIHIQSYITYIYIYTYVCVIYWHVRRHLLLHYSMVGIGNLLPGSTHDKAFSCLWRVFVQAECKQEQPRQVQQATEILSSMMAEPSDDCLDADMESVVQYLRSNKKLRVADDLRRILRMNRWYAPSQF